MDHAICECTRVTDTLFLCSPVQIPGTELEALYIGPKGVYAIADELLQDEPESIRAFLRNFFGTSKVELYFLGKGRFNADSGEPDGPLSDEELQIAIQVHTQEQGFVLWDSNMLERLTEKVRREDARHRGVYRDSDGNWFVARNGNFVPLSGKDSDRILRLTLFGGIIGAHRFALGKWFTGLIYLLTGGLIGLGWFMDLIQIALGSMKDRKKRFISKPKPLSFPWYLAGFAVSFVLFCVYAIVTGIFAGAIGQISLQIAERPEQANALINLLQRFSGQ